MTQTILRKWWEETAAGSGCQRMRKRFNTEKKVKGSSQMMISYLASLHFMSTNSQTHAFSKPSFSFSKSKRTKKKKKSKQRKTVVKQMKQLNLSSKILKQNKKLKRTKWCSTAGRPCQDPQVFSSIQVMFRQILIVSWSCAGSFWFGCTPSPLKQAELLPPASFCP